MVKRKSSRKKKQDGVDTPLTSSPFKRSRQMTTTPVRSPVRSPVRTPIRTPMRSPVRSPMRTPIRTPMRLRVRSQMRSPMSPRKQRSIRISSPTLSPKTRFLRSINNLNDKNSRRKLFGSPIIIAKKKKNKYIPRLKTGRKLGTNLTWI